MRDDSHYIGSVRFFKHLILLTGVSVVLLPIAAFIFLLIQYWELKGNYNEAMNEKQAYISCLEEKLARHEEQSKARDTGIRSEPEVSGQEQKADAEMAEKNEEGLQYPFNINLEEVRYLLVNDTNPLPQSFEPDLVETRNGQMVHKEIKDSLEKMIRDAMNEGLEIIICSAYRDYEKQAKLVENSIEKYRKQNCTYAEAYWKTKRYLEMVGRSEHHTGLAVDLVGADYQSLDEGQADTPESKWLNEHAHKYGFILRYPKEKEEITGILFESWHYRYVGEQEATFIKENQLCLEEFLDLVHRQNEKK